ncbi:MAG: YqeG family HAD IIIA-type phosphatase [Eubacterium sp.]|nr:YqeG family HAD IIIA-type phosphatase [Eubacterium sp.]
MGKGLFPSEYYDSAYSINFQKYYDLGYRGLILDIDNTLVPHDEMHDDRSRELFKKLKEIGFKMCFVSNNDEPRVKEFNDEVGCFYVFNAEKPKIKGYVEAMKKMGTKHETTLFVGDQIFTDILGANRTRLHSILVKPVAKEKYFHIVLKRILEVPIKGLYLINHKLKTK